MLKLLSLFFVLILTSACQSVERAKEQKNKNSVKSHIESVESGKLIYFLVFGPSLKPLMKKANKYCDLNKNFTLLGNYFIVLKNKKNLF